MNTVFIIGNGFDINLGMKTRFLDFLEYYLNVETTSDLIKELKKDISKDIENWSDLELALGRYTAKLHSTREFDEVFEDILDNLARYLQKVEGDFDYSKKDEKKLLDYLAFPENSLPPSEKIDLENYKNKWGSAQWNVSIITFNYTRSCEALLEFNENNTINKHHTHYFVVLQNILHIHGFVDQRMIMGVNDISQISNTDFYDNLDVLEALVKNSCNKAHKQLIETRCENIIKNAQLICIFGSSIGDTDDMWWELIGDQLKTGCKLIIFYRGKDYPLRKDYKKLRDERRLKEIFLNKTKLSEEQKKGVAQSIYIVVNSKMFDLSYENIMKEEMFVT